jgi:hypothetical protein
MILPASSVRPFSENFCSAIDDTFEGTPPPQTANNHRRAAEQQFTF